VLFVLYTGVQWEFLPQELGFGSGPTCWRGLAEWQEAGVWEELQRVLLDGLRAADRLDFSRSTIDALHDRCVPRAGQAGGQAAQKSARARLTAHGRARNTTS
jgi:transposase